MARVAGWQGGPGERVAGWPGWQRGRVAVWPGWQGGRVTRWQGGRVARVEGRQGGRVPGRKGAKVLVIQCVSQRVTCRRWYTGAQPRADCGLVRVFSAPRIQLFFGTPLLDYVHFFVYF